MKRTCLIFLSGILLCVVGCEQHPLPGAPEAKVEKPAGHADGHAGAASPAPKAAH